MTNIKILFRFFKPVLVRVWQILSKTGILARHVANLRSGSNLSQMEQHFYHCSFDLEKLSIHQALHPRNGNLQRFLERADDVAGGRQGLVYSPSGAECRRRCCRPTAALPRLTGVAEKRDS